MKYNSKLILYSSIIFTILLIIGLFLYINVKIIGFTEYDIDYVVGDHIGINLDEDSIHFGTGSAGMVLTRDITIGSDVDIDVKVKLSGIDYVTVEETEFLVLASEKRSLELIATIPPNLENGVYSGKLKIIYFKP